MESAVVLVEGGGTAIDPPAPAAGWTPEKVNVDAVTPSEKSSSEPVPPPGGER